jgi:hypothetical protein
LAALPTPERDSHRKEEIAISATHQFTFHAHWKMLKKSEKRRFFPLQRSMQKAVFVYVL